MPDVRLLPFDTSHLDGLRALLGDPQVLRFTRVPEPVPDGAESWLDAYEAGRRDGTREAFALIGPDRSRYVKSGRREDTELWSRLVTDS